MMTTKALADYVSEIDPSQDLRWDAFVENHPFGWICHTSAWKEILERSFDHMRAAYLVLTNRDTGELMAALPLCHVRSWLTGDRLVSLPFATLCDPLVDSVDQFRMLFNAALGLKDKYHCKYLELRTFQSGDFVSDSMVSLQRNYKHHYLILDEEPRRLMKRFHRSCVRQRINRAEKSDIQVTHANSEKDLKAFYRLYLKTRRRLLLPPQPYRFIRTIWQKLYPLGFLSLLLAIHKDQPIGAIMLLKFKHRVSAEYAAFDENLLNMSPNHLLFWMAIKEAQEEGYHVFDFGRTSPDNRGLMDFKRRWGTEVVDLIHAFSPTGAAQQLSGHTGFSHKLVARFCKWAPSAPYRALGNFCYRHMG
jgi:CelD/BcsL family acetyltransferase involved in cellulose biosynthesis